MSGEDGVPTRSSAEALADPPADAGADWTHLDTEIVWENPYFIAGYDEVEQPDGERGRYYWIDPGDFVAVVAETDAGEVVLLEQYSVRLDRSLLTCPGGAVDEGESFVEAGVRELREETGLRAGEAEFLEAYEPTAWTRMTQAVVYATDLEPGTPDLESGEDIDAFTVPADEAVAAVRARECPFGGGLTPLLVAREEGLLD
ncbi:NUDIX hydrolase [Halosimplex sp. TS25]|uniref:NUDIX hydrolase n=1 Tax=Halosimplex rarum TaxID=3396619 RepID=UPI0039EBB465